jgi:PKD repeat protein
MNIANRMFSFKYKFLIFYRTILLFVLVIGAKNALAQPLTVETGTVGSSACPGINLAIPVTVRNMIGVDSIQLTLTFDPNVLIYKTYRAVNQQIAGGYFNIDNQTDKVIITWKRSSPASLINDTLVELIFFTASGTTTLAFDEPNCFYYDPDGNLMPDDYSGGTINIYNKINLLITEIDATCTNACDANYMVNSTGGSGPYTYLWNGSPGRFDSIQTNLCSGYNELLVTDNNGCEIDSLFVVNGMPGANVKIIIEPDSIIYLQNPTLSFRFDEVSPTHVTEAPLWDFGDGDTARSFNPTHTFTTANSNQDGYFLLSLLVKNENGCDSLIQMRLPIKEAKIRIPNVMTPNGDGSNDAFMVINEDKNSDDWIISNEFERLELYMFDRWGRRVYANSDYKGDWTAQGMPDGVYYYVIKTIGYYKTEKYKGSLTILGSKVK